MKNIKTEILRFFFIKYVGAHMWWVCITRNPGVVYKLATPIRFDSMMVVRKIFLTHSLL